MAGVPAIHLYENLDQASLAAYEAAQAGSGLILTFMRKLGSIPLAGVRGQAFRGLDQSYLAEKNI